MKAIVLLSLCLLTFQLSAKERRRAAYKFTPLELAPFSTDGCSAYPDGYPMTSTHEWLHCCFAHDIKYWRGGTREEKIAADQELNQCVSEASFGLHGKMMEQGVSLGGTPYVATRWRWGYGWNHYLGFKAIDADQEKEIHLKAYTILDALSLETFYFTEEQIEYVLDSYQNFRTRNLEKARR